MDFDNLPHLVLMEVMTYVSIQDRFENIRLVSKWWKSVAEDSLRRQRKLTFLADEEEIKIKPTDHHSIIQLNPWRRPKSSQQQQRPRRYWSHTLTVILRSMKMKIERTDHHSIIQMNSWRRPKSSQQQRPRRYWSHVFSLCPNLEELHMYQGMETYLDQLNYDVSVTELLNLMHSHGIKLKSFTNGMAHLHEWPFPLEILESLAVREVSDDLVVKILHESTNLRHLELSNCRDWPTFPSGLLSLKFNGSYYNQELSKLMNSPAFDTIESLEEIYFNEEFDPQTKVFPKLRHVGIGLREEGCLESCNKLITFLVEKIPLLESLGLDFHNKGATDILFSIPQLVDVLRQLKILDIEFNNHSTTVDILNVLRSCQNTELSMVQFDCFGKDGSLLNDLLSFLVDMSGNIKYFDGYTFKQPVKVSDLDILRQLHTSHEIVLKVSDKTESNLYDYLDIPQVDIQNFVTEEERQKDVVYMEITAR